MFRCVPHPVSHRPGVRGHPFALSGAGDRTEAPEGKRRCLENHLTNVDRSRCVYRVNIFLFFIFKSFTLFLSGSHKFVFVNVKGFPPCSCPSWSASSTTQSSPGCCGTSSTPSRTPCRGAPVRSMRIAQVTESLAIAIADGTTHGPKNENAYVSNSGFHSLVHLQ